MDPALSERSTVDLLKDALRESSTLLETELKLAKAELESGTKEAIGAAGALATATVAALFGLAALIAALAAALGASPAWCLCITGVGMLALSVVGGAVGFSVVPTHLLSRTRRQVHRDAREMEKHGA